MTMTPTDFEAITGLRVGEEPAPFDSGIHNDRAALKWFLGKVPKIEEGVVRYKQFTEYLKKEVTTEREAEQMARAYLLYLFGASLYPGRRSKVHLSYLPALRDLKTASHFDWGRAALSATYDFLGDSSRTEQSTAGYWRVWEWYLGDKVTRQSLGDTEFQVSGPLPPRALHTGEYTSAEVEQFTRLDTKLTHYLRPEIDYAAYQRDRLAGLLGVRAFRDVLSQACGAAEERRAAEERQRGGEGRVRRSLSGPVPNEWVNEAIHHMLAMENVIRRAASGMPLELHYPAPNPPPAQRAVTQRPHTRSSLPVEASQEAARKAIVRAEERYQIMMCERPSQKERDPKRARVTKPEVVEVKEEEEEEEEGEEEVEQRPSTSSGSDDSTDDPPYKKDPQEQEDDDDSEDWLGAR
ncbi:hypothetical protein RHMOL_Rhmol13G0167500 [Rhododendron molle]|uniref:Uncharacterized protein n=1 Tax=Rhododendron molle TaxID=49168 RepID=A0ACC0L842_RHOML|nr:hypothetical protein RHMOL_Rhmol13G0167500 [Rhododendron molle]